MIDEINYEKLKSNDNTQIWDIKYYTTSNSEDIDKDEEINELK